MSESTTKSTTAGTAPSNATSVNSPQNTTTGGVSGNKSKRGSLFMTDLLKTPKQRIFAPEGHTHSSEKWLGDDRFHDGGKPKI
jgi:hypothetical protein